MTFGSFVDNDLFEFIVRNGSGKPAIIFVEAKRSVPRESDLFFAEIRLKMIHALTVWFTAVCGRQEKLNNLIPDNLKQAEHLKLPIKMCLVIPEVPDQYLIPLSDKFRQFLRAERMIWAIGYSDISVLNASRAKKYGLIGRDCIA
jgi:hypothetical protein